jgi:hypothetical protein
MPVRWNVIAITLFFGAGTLSACGSEGTGADPASSGPPTCEAGASCTFKWTGADAGEAACVATYSQIAPGAFQLWVRTPSSPTGTRWVGATFLFPAELVAGTYDAAGMTSADVVVDVDGTTTWAASSGGSADAGAVTVDLASGVLATHVAHGTLSATLPATPAGTGTVTVCAAF